jgi:hypothetical protein
MTGTPCVISAADHTGWAHRVCVAAPRGAPAVIETTAGDDHRCWVADHAVSVAQELRVSTILASQKSSLPQAIVTRPFINWVESAG